MGRRRGDCDLFGVMKMMLYLAIVLVTLDKTATVDAYKIGVGRADCTGPSVEVIFVSIRLL